MIMTKEQLFKKYNINESHSEWDNRIDNWISVEIFRIMHNGRLPTETDTSLKYIIDFSNKIRDPKLFGKNIGNNSFGSLYLTSKRMLYRFSDLILEENI
jgi:hypothetical protein